MDALPASKADILVVSEGISYCHVVRPLIVSQWLRELGHSIMVACPSTHRALFEDNGFSTIPIKTADPSRIYSRLAVGKTLYSESELGAYYQADSVLLEELRPRVVVADFRFTIQQLCVERYGVPLVGITSASCHPGFDTGGTVPNCFLPPLFPPVLADRLQATPIGTLLQKSIVTAVSRPYRTASRKAGLTALPSFFHYASQGDICLLADDPTVMPIKALRPQDIYTGALLWRRSDPLPADLSLGGRAKPRVYITVGTQESMSLGFLGQLLERLLHEGFELVLSKGKRDFEVSVRHDNLYVYDFINESKLLPLVDLWIYHGSAMSTYQGLGSGIPMISLPVQADQHFHSQAVVRLACGHLVRPRELNCGALVRLARSLVQDAEVRRNCASVADKVRTYSGREEVLEKVESLVRSASPVWR